MTKGYTLPARYVIHTVGPVWRGGTDNEPDLLRNCYANALELAAHHGVSSIAFPSISTGVYRFPIEQASRIAVATVREKTGKLDGIELVRFVCFSEGDLAVYRTLL